MNSALTIKRSEEAGSPGGRFAWHGKGRVQT